MKKITYTLLTLFVTLSTSAFAQVKFAVTGGTTIANFYTTEASSPDFKLRSKVGITAGVQAAIPAGKRFIIEPALNFTQKGTRQKETPSGVPYKYRMNLNYLELPVNFIYNTTTNTSGLFIGAGPSIAYALNGKYSMELGTDKEEHEILFGEDEDVRRIDAGANFLMGYRFSNKIFASVNYNLGLTNFDKDADPDDHERVNSRYLGIRLGYRF